MFSPKNIILKLIVATVTTVAATNLFAAGVQPFTSVVLVDEAEGEYGMNVRNTDKTAVLLYTSLQTIEDDPENLLIVTPPVSRVEGGGIQLVRFILKGKEPLKVQRLMRVYFEGIPLRTSRASNNVAVTVRQNLPVIISPRNLAPEHEPWKYLRLALCGEKIQVSNDSPYVVRLAQMATLQPSGTAFSFPKPYLLPNTRLMLDVKPDAAASSVRIHPASVYGFAVDQYDTTLSACSI